jgi:hypothetical protein
MTDFMKSAYRIKHGNEVRPLALMWVNSFLLNLASLTFRIVTSGGGAMI